MSITSTAGQSTEIFDRNRLFVDLDEATEPGYPPSVLLVVGLRGLGETIADGPSNPIVSRLRDRLVGIVGGSGSTYGTRLTELCAILDGSLPVLAEVLGAIKGDFAREAAQVDVRVSVGFAELPAEAADAPSALALADRRMTAADGPNRGD